MGGIVIVGAGQAGGNAAVAARDAGYEGDITLIGTEAHLPYERPPLSKDAITAATMPPPQLFFSPEKLAHRAITTLTGTTATEIRAAAHELVLADGRTLRWEKLLLATGSQPREIPGADGVIWFRTLDDYHRLRGAVGDGARVAVIGGGFIGSEIAAALVDNGAGVTMLFPEPGIGFRLFPTDLSASVTDYYREKGVDVLAGEMVASASGDRVETRSGRTIEADAVVAGLGVVPDVELASAAGLEVEDGIVVDEYGRALGQADVFAAGDVARFPVLALGTSMRIEHEDHANSHGRAVGANMAGAETPYDHLPFFYSDLFDLGYEAVGAVDSRLEAVEDWQEPFRKGVVTYVDDGRPRGVLLWNVWDKLDAARDVIRAGEGALAV